MIKQALFSITGGIIGAVAFFVLHGMTYKEPGFAVVDLQALIAEHIVTTSETEKHGNDELKRIGDQFQSSLTVALNHIESSQNVTLLVKPAVISDMTDYTDIVREMMGEINVSQ